MAHKKKENRDRKRKQPIPQACAIPTKKQRQASDRRITKHDLEEIKSLYAFKRMMKEQMKND